MQVFGWKSLFFLFAVICVVLFGLFYDGSPGSESTKPIETTVTSTKKYPVVVLLPHQDDEMFLAGSVINYVEQGKDVYAVMVTDGAHSSARLMLNGQDDLGKPYCCDLKGKVHNPEKEGYEVLDKQHFSAARNREFFTSMIRLGIHKENIFFANPGGLEVSTAPLYKDGSLTKTQAKAVIEIFYKKFGDGTYITIESRQGYAYHRNPDHAALQDALIEFPGISEKYYFTDIQDKATRVDLSREVLRKKRDALNIYYEWEPRKGKFAVGAHSVKYLLDEWSTNSFEYRSLN